MNIVFAGTPEVAVPALEAFHASAHTIRAVLTRADAPVGRKRVLTPSPVKTRALELGYPVIEANKLRGDVIEELRVLDVDAVAVVAFGAIAGPKALSIATYGWFNLHFSLLPAYRGAAPVQRALMSGRTHSGVTVFKIDEGMDTGALLHQVEMPLDHPDAAAALADYAHRGAPELVAAFDDLASGTAVLTEQTGEPSVADKLSQADARLDFTETARTLIDLSRGVTPSPGPWAEVDGKATKLFGLGPVVDDTDEPVVPGRLCARNKTALLGARDEWIAVSEIQPFGKPRMAATDYLRGHGDVQFDSAPPREQGA